VMFGGVDKDLQMAGLAQAQVMLKVDKGIFRVMTDSTKVTNFKLAASGKEPFIQDQIALVFDGWFDPAQKIWATEKIQVTSPQIKIAGDFADSKPGEQGNLKGNLQIEYDWSAVSKMLAAFMPDQLEILGKRSDRITVSSDYRRDVEGSLVQNLTTEANIGFEQAKYMGLDVGTTDVKMQMAKGALAIAPFSTTVNNGMLNFGGVVDMTQQSKLKPTEKMILFKTLGPVDIIKYVQLNDELANKLLARVNPIFKDAIGVTGVANFKCDKMLIALKGGADSDTDIEGTISLTQFNMQPTGIFGEILKATGASQGQKMTLHPTKFTVKNGYISYDNMQLDIGDNPIIFKGVLPLDPNEQIKEFSLTLPYTVAGRTVRTGGDTGERRITGYIKGTMKNPELDIEKIVQEELIQTGLDLLFKELNK